MTFFAIDKSSDLKVDIRSVTKVYRSGEIKCVMCDQDLIPKYSPFVSSHFAHYPGSEYCALMADDTSESALHKLTKGYLSKLLSVESEAMVEFSLGHALPRADILARYNNLDVAHEVQLSDISRFNLQTRIYNLDKCRVGQNWWLGKGALNPWNKRIVQVHQGFASYLDIPGDFDLPQPMVEKVIYDGPTPYIARSDYPVIKPEGLQSAKYYKFIGTNGNFSMWKIIDADGKLVHLQNILNDGIKIWTYLRPPRGISIFGKAIQANIYSVTRQE